MSEAAAKCPMALVATRVPSVHLALTCRWCMLDSVPVDPYSIPRETQDLPAHFTRHWICTSSHSARPTRSGLHTIEAQHQRNPSIDYPRRRTRRHVSRTLPHARPHMYIIHSISHVRHPNTPLPDPTPIIPNLNIILQLLSRPAPPRPAPPRPFYPLPACLVRHLPAPHAFQHPQPALPPRPEVLAPAPPAPFPVVVAVPAPAS